MITINTNSGHHKFEKQNLVTVHKGKKHFDILKCSVCGLEGRTNSLSTMAVKSSYSMEKINCCPGYVPEADNNKYQYTVLCSPWIHDLPDGTEIVPVAGKEDWYTRKDNKPLFENTGEKEFKLFDHEINKVKID